MKKLDFLIDHLLSASFFKACRLEEPLDFAKPIDETSKVVKDTASVIVADGNGLAWIV